MRPNLFSRPTWPSLEREALLALCQDAVNAFVKKEEAAMSQVTERRPDWLHDGGLGMSAQVRFSFAERLRSARTAGSLAKLALLAKGMMSQTSPAHQLRDHRLVSDIHALAHDFRTFALFSPNSEEQKRQRADRAYRLNTVLGAIRAMANRTVHGCSDVALEGELAQLQDIGCDLGASLSAMPLEGVFDADEAALEPDGPAMNRF